MRLAGRYCQWSRWIPVSPCMARSRRPTAVPPRAVSVDRRFDPRHLLPAQRFVCSRRQAPVMTDYAGSETTGTALEPIPEGVPAKSITVAGSIAKLSRVADPTTMRARDSVARSPRPRSGIQSRRGPIPAFSREALRLPVRLSASMPRPGASIPRSAGSFPVTRDPSSPVHACLRPPTSGPVESRDQYWRRRAHSNSRQHHPAVDPSFR